MTKSNACTGYDRMWSRRDLMAAAGGLGLSFMMPTLSAKAADKRGKERQKSLIVLYMAGGPSQLETFDPHPGSEIGGLAKAIPTQNTELKICDLYPRTAEQIHHLSVIRSMVSKEGDHERGTYLLKTGYRPDPTLKHPSLGAIAAHELPNEDIDIPMHVTLGGGPFPARGGFLGDEFDAFKIFNPGNNIQNMESRVSKERQDRRLKNLSVVSRVFRSGRRSQTENTLHQLTIERALAMMSSKQLKSFKIEEESEATKKAYGDHRFGRGCLVARRLVEEGVRAVEVVLPGWDSHANNHEGHITQANILDPAFSALIKDLADRDLLESTVVLWIGEFGRTPKINALDGRDHWPTGFSCVVGGGGINGGLLIGETDPTGKEKDPKDPIEVHDLYATILHTLGVDYEMEVNTPIGRPMAYSKGQPLERLLAKS